MNFLAHIYLSGENNELLIGNFIGDFVKGRQLHEYPEMVQKGIHLHRSIDSYTDVHPTVLKSKKRLRMKYRHYAPVIVDIFYDHFLANHWDRYHNQPLKEFTQQTFQTINLYLQHLPQRAKHMYVYMRRDNWLWHYQSIEGIQKALSGMARRTSFESKMDESTHELKEHYSEFALEFNSFFPDLIAHCEEFRNSSSNSQ